MKHIILSAALSFAGVSAYHHFGRQELSKWAPAGPNDFRGPCPMMNTLANHGFLPHDGRNFTKANAVYALSTAINFNTSLSELMWEQAIIANPGPNATFFTLDHLNRHNVLEHDAGMSRSDAFFGNNHVFNQTIFDETRQYWTAGILDAKQLANGKLARQITSRAYNPNYTFTATTEEFILGEVAAPIIVFGDMQAGTVNKSLVEYFFQNERLPSELGWTKKVNPVSLEDVIGVGNLIRNATSLLTPSSAAPHAKRWDLHAGFRF
ncbi:Cloroperoxidase [Zopfia rhizophila CBS 207.26]|uniref:Cloroperoxidase n=1 Tax=Zopfia rhizophila CBS 207.26 TaxID=1314779 RepID=A0A6A6EH08_9PEZI|nr:Cloroperoxidase [Zopfia rhizophila CBS 207.26]